MYGSFMIRFLNILLFFCCLTKFSISIEKNNNHFVHSVEVFEHCYIHKNYAPQKVENQFICDVTNIVSLKTLNTADKAQIFFLANTLWNLYIKETNFESSSLEIFKIWTDLDKLWKLDADLYKAQKDSLNFDYRGFYKSKLYDESSKIEFFKKLYEESYTFLNDYFQNKEISKLETLISGSFKIKKLIPQINMIGKNLSEIVEKNKLELVNTPKNKSTYFSLFTPHAIFSYLWYRFSPKPLSVEKLNSDIPQAPVFTKKLIIKNPSKKETREISQTPVENTPSFLQELRQKQEKKGILTKEVGQEGVNQTDHISLEKNIDDNFLQMKNTPSDLIVEIKNFSHDKLKKINNKDQIFTSFQKNHEQIAKMIEGVFVRTSEKMKEIQKLYNYEQGQFQTFVKIFDVLNQYIYMEPVNQNLYIKNQSIKLWLTKRYLENKNVIDASYYLNHLWLDNSDPNLYRHDSSPRNDENNEIEADLDASINVGKIKSIWDYMTDNTIQAIFASEVFLKLCDPDSSNNILKDDSHLEDMKNLFDTLRREINSPSKKFPWLNLVEQENLNTEQKMVQSLYKALKNRREKITPTDSSSSEDIYGWGED